MWSLHALGQAEAMTPYYVTISSASTPQGIVFVWTSILPLSGYVCYVTVACYILLII